MENIITIALFLLGLGLGYLIARKTGGGDTALARDNTALSTRLQTAAEDRKELQQALEQARRELTEARERVVVADADKRNLDQRLKEQQQELEKMQERLKLEFKNTASSLFEDISKKFSTQSEKQIGDLLTPLRERLGEFQKMVGDSFSTQGKEQHTLKAEIEKIVLQTDSLTKALRGDVKAQGNWGEIMLERILEESGLQKGSDYIVQGVEMGLLDASGNRQQPDVIIKLPDNKHIIVDAKVSLTAYERYCTEPADSHSRDFLKSVRAHVNGLEQRRYQDNEKLGTPDFVLMFMPVEGAYSFAVQQDRELHSYAWGKKIVLVCPSTLFATLRTISSLWSIERQNRNAHEIARQGGALYDKFVGFIEDMQSIGKQISRTQDIYDQAIGKLYRGSGNLVARAEKLRQLDAKVSKSLPKGLTTEDSEDAMRVEG